MDDEALRLQCEALLRERGITLGAALDVLVAQVSAAVGAPIRFARMVSRHGGAGVDAGARRDPDGGFTIALSPDRPAVSSMMDTCHELGHILWDHLASDAMTVVELAEVTTDPQIAGARQMMLEFTRCGSYEEYSERQAEMTATLLVAAMTQVAPPQTFIDFLER